jgi:hypothetical protein
MSMSSETSRSEELRREAEELRAIAQRPTKDAAYLLDKSIQLENKISRNNAKPDE